MVFQKFESESLRTKFRAANHKAWKLRRRYPILHNWVIYFLKNSLCSFEYVLFFASSGLFDRSKLIFTAVPFSGAVLPNLILKVVTYRFSMLHSALHTLIGSPDWIDALTIFSSSWRMISHGLSPKCDLYIIVFQIIFILLSPAMRDWLIRDIKPTKPGAFRVSARKKHVWDIKITSTTVRCRFQPGPIVISYRFLHMASYYRYSYRLHRNMPHDIYNW